VTPPVATTTVEVGDVEGDVGADDVADADDVAAALGALELPHARSATNRTITTTSTRITARTKALRGLRASA
jgi:hypothetical protein